MKKVFKMIDLDCANCAAKMERAISALDGVEMNAYGQLDRLLYPFYVRDTEAGILDHEEAYYLLQCFLHKTDMHCHFNEERQTYDNGVSVMIGGCDLDGTNLPDGFNGIHDLYKIADVCLSHGYSEETVKKIFYKNYYEFIKRNFT